MYACPGSIITYTCVLESNSPGAVFTVWSGSAFNCPRVGSLIGLLQKSFRVRQPFTRVSCGNLSAVTTHVNSSCYTSVLTIPANEALDGTTVICADAYTDVVVGNGTLKIKSEVTIHQGNMYMYNAELVYMYGFSVLF